MAETVAKPKAHIDALTGIRFLAALVVYLSHHPQPAYLPDWLVTFFKAGYYGVTIFFVLSGFVIGLNYFDSLAKPTRGKILQFGVARLARVYPLYLIVLLCIWWDKGAPLTLDAIIHFLALQAWSPDMGLALAFNGPGWSIGVEFFLYACFPLIALALAPLAKNKKALWSLALLVIIVMVVLAVGFQLTGHGALPWGNPDSAHRWLYRTPLTRLGDFVLGVIAALLFKNRVPLGGPSNRAWALVSYSGIAGILALMLWPNNLYSVFSWDVAGAVSTLFLILGLALTPQTFLARILGSRPLVILGEASFALYLIHVPLIRWAGIERYTVIDPWIAILLWLGFVIALIVLSIGLHTYIETPLRHLVNGLAAGPGRNSKPHIWFSEGVWKRSVLRGLGLVGFLLVYFSIARWLWEQAPFLNALVQGRSSILSVQAHLGNGIQLLESSVDTNPPIGGGALHLWLKWSCNGTITDTNKIQIELRDTKERVWVQGKDESQGIILPCRKQFLSMTSQATQVVVFFLPVTMPTGEYAVVLTQYDPTNDNKVVALQDSRNTLREQIQIGKATISKNQASFTASEFFIENPFFVDMQEIRFLGYTALPKQVKLGDELDVGLYWRARGKPRGDYRVEIQLRDEVGNTIFEQSARPAEDTYPTTGWKSGEVLLDWHRITLPRNVPQGEYQLAVVLREVEQSQIIGDTKFFTISLVQ